LSDDQSIAKANKAVIERCYREMVNPAEWSRLPEFATPDVVAHAPVPGTPFRGHEGVIRLLEFIRSAFPDRRIQAEFMIAEGDRVAVRTVLHGTHLGDYAGFRPTARRVAVDEHGIYSIVGGKIREAWFIPNIPSSMRQLGLPSGPLSRPMQLLMSLFAGGPGTGARERAEAVPDDVWRGRAPSSPQAAANKAHAARGFEEVWKAHNRAAAGELYAPDLAVHVPEQSEPIDREGLRQRLEMLHGAFPDLQLTLQDLVAEDDLVVSRWTLTGTQRGPYFGCPPSGRRVVMSTIDLSRFEDGKIAELWTMPDAFGGLQQIGAVPAGPPPRALIAIMGLGQRFKTLLTPRQA
jgi:steroid delta-isomerase-like uncharacterized protein